MRWKMKKTIAFLIFLVFSSTGLFVETAYGASASMNDYCVVPPYVIQDVQSDIMFLVDNSGSMYNMAYACPNSLTTTAGTNTNQIPLKSVAGFKVGQEIWMSTGAGVGTPLWIESIDTVNNVLTVGANVPSFAQSTRVMDYGCRNISCSGGSPCFYYDDETTCPTSTSKCDNPGTYPYSTVKTAHSSTTVDLISVSGFTVGETIIIVHSGTNYTKTISSINTSNNTLTVNSSVTTSIGDVVKDQNYDTCNAYSSGANILLSGVSGFVTGEIIVVLDGGVPTTTTITSINTGTKTIQVSPGVSVSASDTIYDYNCYNYQTPAPEMSFDPNNSYYGYFNSDYWYTYNGTSGNKKFGPSRLKSAGAKASNEWDGNFLNWLTMRRSDIIRKVLTGGNAVGGEGTGFNKIRTIRQDATVRGLFKAVSNAEQYIDCSAWSCTANTNASFTFNPGSSDPSQFYFSRGAGSVWTDSITYSVDIVVPTPVEGVLQDVIGTKARIGITFYNGPSGGNPGDGGFVQVAVGGTSLSSVVNQVNLTAPSANTPLGEALWSVTGYFAQQSSLEGGPGPRYHSGDYQLNNNNDPFNYGTGGSPRWPTCAKGYVVLVTDGEPCADGNLPATISNYTSGRSQFACSGSSCPATSGTAPENYSFPASTLPSCPAGGNVAGVEDVALYMHTNDLRSDINKTQDLTLYTIFAFGSGSTLLKYASINGGFNDFDNTGMPDQQSKWDANGDGEPDNYYEASEGYGIEQAMRSVLSTILSRASSGTAASVLASGEGSGSNLVQAIFYPRRRFGNDIIGWTGENQNFWYYIDPFFRYSNIREDTVHESPDKLNLLNDYITSLYFDSTAQETLAARYKDVNGDGGSSLIAEPTIPIEDVANIWKAGLLLWSRDLSSDPRTIYTPCLSGGTCIGSSNLMPFQTSGDGSIETALEPYLQLTGDLTRTQDVIRYVNGYDTTLDGQDFTTVDRNSDSVPDYRLRTVTIGSDTHVWKMGDVIDSTPRIVSWLPLNNYHYKYHDATYKNFIGASSPANYLNRGMVFTGANDGMLHAFKLGKLELPNTSSNTTCTWASHDVACLSGTNLGRELWAFVPKNVLPYLKYILDPDYCHVYSVDLTPVVVDASIGDPTTGDISTDDRASDGSTWRTILIGGMRLGGGCKTKVCSITATQKCSQDSDCPGGQTCVTPCANCVGTPILDPADSTKGLGYSSYFALDITDFLAHQNDSAPPAPTLLWEFTNDNLGFSSTGPLVLREGVGTQNGNWFAVFGSGPTGPINTTYNQFLGKSDQNMKIFVLDLKTGSLEATIDTGITKAFADSIGNTHIDLDVDYQDDTAYLGYTKLCTDSTHPCTLTEWTDGGIGALVTGNSTDPTAWRWRTIMDGIGPVTASTTSAAFLDQAGVDNLWIWFGTGRYYFAQGTTIDDPNTQRRLFGIKDPCFLRTEADPSGLNNACITTLSTGDLRDVTCSGGLSGCVPTTTEANSASFKGWLLNLDLCSNASNAPVSCTNSSVVFQTERVITNPLYSPSTGNVLFATYKPYITECSIGGQSFIWALQGTTGAAPGSTLKGSALLQVSTGSIQQENLSSAFKNVSGSNPYSEGERRTAGIEGVPPTSQGLTILVAPLPVNRVIHIKER
jgi:type IV pilus assembly protein PilY1